MQEHHQTRRRVTLGLALLVAVVGALVTVIIPSSAARARPLEGGEPALVVTRDQVGSALACRNAAARPSSSPILLIHGTSANPKANWSWNWVRALTAEGRTHCTLKLPDMANGDIQLSAEYVVQALRIMHHRWGHDVSMVGHSQGGMIGRWALKYWPKTRGLVDDYVGLAASNHGTVAFNRCEATSRCTPATWQQRDGSDFITALNRGPETWPGIDYTEIATTYDEAIVPYTSSFLKGSAVTNVTVQDLCPSETVEHLLMAGDNAAWLLAWDALTHQGPARLGRVDTSTCGRPFMPGVDPAAFPGQAVEALIIVFGSDSAQSNSEPRVRCYARPGCRG